MSVDGFLVESSHGASPYQYKQYVYSLYVIGVAKFQTCDAPPHGRPKHSMAATGFLWKTAPVTWPRRGITLLDDSFRWNGYPSAGDRANLGSQLLNISYAVT